jgi:hypothetical protein
MLEAVNAIVPVTLPVIGLACFLAALILALPLRTQSIKGTAVIAGVGALALVMTRLPDITLLDALGIRTELQHTINEANATIAQLRKLAVTIAEPELSQLAMSGAMLSELRFEYQYDQKKQIVDTMKSLGVSQEDITAALRVWTPATLRKLSNVIAEAIGKTDKALGGKIQRGPD